MATNESGGSETRPTVPQLLTSKEAAQTLSISPRKLWSMTASGELPSVRIGRAVRYSIDDLREVIESLTKGGEA